MRDARVAEHASSLQVLPPLPKLGTLERKKCPLQPEDPVVDPGHAGALARSGAGQHPLDAVDGRSVHQHLQDLDVVLTIALFLVILRYGEARAFAAPAGLVNHAYSERTRGPRVFPVGAVQSKLLRCVEISSSAGPAPGTIEDTVVVPEPLDFIQKMPVGVEDETDFALGRPPAGGDRPAAGHRSRPRVRCESSEPSKCALRP